MNNQHLPPYQNFPVLANDLVTLRRIREQDINRLIEISYYDSIQAQNRQQALEMLGKIEWDYELGNSIHWGIMENENNKIVGTCGYYRGFPNAEGELGCVLLPGCRGAGYMTSAMQLAVEFGKTQLKLRRIWAVTSKENQKAIRLLKRLNFKKVKDLQDNEVEFEVI